MTRTIGAWLKAARERAGLTQRDLAARVGIANVTISNYEAGRRQPSPEHISVLARELGLDGTEAIVLLVRDRLERTDEGRIFLAEARAGRFYDDESSGIT